MRTKVIDTNRRVRTFDGVFDGSASGNGLANDIPFSWIRTVAGDYTLKFSSTMYPLSIVGNSSVGLAAPIFANNGFGTCRIQSINAAGALQDGIIQFHIATRITR